MEKKRNKITLIVLVSLLTVSLIWNLIFKLPSVSVEISRLIHSNPITDMLENIYWDGIPSLISIPISFTNLIYAIVRSHSVFKSKPSSKKRFIGYLIYAVVSLGALIIHCITFDYIFGALVAG